MENIEGMLGGVHQYCGYPDAQKFLSVARRKLLGNLDYYYNLLALTNNSNWLIKSCLFEVQTGVDIYNITTQTGDFGREILVETFDENNPDFRRRDIDIVAIQDLDKAYQGRQQPIVSGNYQSRHSAVAMAFYGLPEMFIRVVPIPNQSAIYRIWYEPQKAANEPKLADTPIMIPGFVDLVVIHTALNCLSDCEWAEFSILEVNERFKLNQAKRQEKRADLQPDFDRKWAAFNDYRLSSKHEQDLQRKGYNSYRYDQRRLRTRWNF